MKQVGIDYTGASARAIRKFAFLMSPFAVVYIILAMDGFVPHSLFLTPSVALGFCVAWVIAALYYYFFPSETKGQKHARVLVYHGIGMATLIGVVGVATPVSALYILLMIAAHMFYGRRGLILSSLFFAASAFVDAYVVGQLNGDTYLENLTTAIVVIVLGVALVGFMTTQETRRKTLLQSRRRAKLQQERIETIMNNLSDATFSVNELGVISMYNAACLALLDLNIDLKGKKINDILKLSTTEGKRVSVLTLLKKIDRSTTRDDLLHKYGDGETVRLEMTIAPIRSSYSASKRKEEQGGFIVIIRDVTKQKSLEEERDEFISVVSHELRTPITIAEGTISNLALLMERGFEKVEPALLNKTVETAHDQIIYLARMVNDLSTLSRAERGVAAEAEHIDIQQLVTDLFQKYQPEATEQGLQLNLDAGTSLGSVYVSKLYLEELLQNFVTNAIKYTHEGSVTIIAKKNKDMIKLAVKDTGIGMSRTDQAKVFDKFYRSEDYRIRETSGTGLGLYVSAKLAHKLNTKINLESRVNFGSTFSFELPLEDTKTERS